MRLLAAILSKTFAPAMLYFFESVQERGARFARLIPFSSSRALFKGTRGIALAFVILAVLTVTWSDGGRQTQQTRKHRPSPPV